MKITFLESEAKLTLAPFENYSGKIGEFPVAGSSLADLQKKRLTHYLPNNYDEIKIRSDFWPSKALLSQISNAPTGKILDKSGAILIDLMKTAPTVQVDNDSIIINYPWDFIKINEEVISELSKSSISGTVRNGVTIDGNIALGEGSVLLPGVYIEGNAIIGKNCKIGPNCYIRGSTYIGDSCHIGQAVEVKNSLIMNKVSIGHLSYVGDSVIGANTNFGAGTITANLRHDGKNHRSILGSELVDTGRRKLGVIVGEGVHTGINTTIYPGRKIHAHASTLPGEIIKTDQF